MTPGHPSSAVKRHFIWKRILWVCIGSVNWLFFFFLFFYGDLTSFLLIVNIILAWFFICSDVGLNRSFESSTLHAFSTSPSMGCVHEQLIKINGCIWNGMNMEQMSSYCSRSISTQFGPRSETSPVWKTSASCRMTVITDNIMDGLAGRMLQLLWLV